MSHNIDFELRDRQRAEKHLQRENEKAERRASLEAELMKNPAIAHANDIFKCRDMMGGEFGVRVMKAEARVDNINKSLKEDDAKYRRASAVMTDFSDKRNAENEEEIREEKEKYAAIKEEEDRKKAEKKLKAEEAARKRREYEARRDARRNSRLNEQQHGGEAIPVSVM